MGKTLPNKSISPVIPISVGTACPENEEIIAVVNAVPALGPSLGVAPSGA